MEVLVTVREIATQAQAKYGRVSYCLTNVVKIAELGHLVATREKLYPASSLMAVRKWLRRLT